MSVMGIGTRYVKPHMLIDLKIRNRQEFGLSYRNELVKLSNVLYCGHCNFICDGSDGRLCSE